MIEIPLTRGYVAIVDDCDSDLAQYKWSTEVNRSASGGVCRYYAKRADCTNKKKKHVVMHNVILERILGRPLLKGEFCDHIHHNGLDNRRSEIRLADQCQNNQNRRLQKNNTSGYKGVWKEKGRNSWRAKIDVNSKTIRLGKFSTPEEAYAAYCEAAIKYHGEFANFGTVKPATIIQLPLFDLDKGA